MARVVLTPRAQADVDDIWAYTAETWGAEQAATYVRLIKTGVEAIAAKPLAGRTCNDVRPGYRKRHAGSHVIFYRMTAQGIEVVRILHERMDFGRHL